MFLLDNWGKENRVKKKRRLKHEHPIYRFSESSLKRSMTLLSSVSKLLFVFFCFCFCCYCLFVFS